MLPSPTSSTNSPHSQNNGYKTPHANNKGVAKFASAVACCGTGTATGISAGVLIGKTVASAGWPKGASIFCGCGIGLSGSVIFSVCMICGTITVIDVCCNFLNSPVAENSDLKPVTGTTNNNPIEKQPMLADQRGVAVVTTQPPERDNSPYSTLHIAPSDKQHPPSYDTPSYDPPSYDPPSYKDSVRNSLPQATQDRTAPNSHSKNTDPDRPQEVISASRTQNGSGNTASVQINTSRENISSHFKTEA